MYKPQASFATALTILAWPMALLHPPAAAMLATERSLNQSHLVISAIFFWGFHFPDFPSKK